MIIHGDCLERLREMPDNSIDAVVTDPPYGLAFMGKRWDYDVPGADIWRECLRVLKPGGHMLAFGGTRTYHRLVVAIEDAGFEVRDMVSWIYGSGFPKSLDISKAIDKAAGAVRIVTGTRKLTGKARVLKGGNFDGGYEGKELNEEYEETAPATDAAKQWDGWGTALKPAQEPICLARKPISEKNIAANVLKWGTGGLNIDASRIAGPIPQVPQPKFNTSGEIYNMKTGVGRNGELSRAEGRFPANLLLDEQAALMLDDQSGTLKSGERKPGYVRRAGNCYSPDLKPDERSHSANHGGASRFFYVAKASKAERNAGCEGLPVQKAGVGDDRPSGQSMQRLDGRDERAMQNVHPTVKPIKLMTYLIRMVTPPGGTVLDPFAGSGSTGVAAVKEGFNFIGIEREAEYVKIAEARISALHTNQGVLDIAVNGARKNSKAEITTVSEWADVSGKNARIRRAR